jgi:hypothetical protein
MDYIGGQTVFRFSVIYSNRGAVYGQTVTQTDRRVFFYADDGFFEVNGDALKAIGEEKVNRFFEHRKLINYRELCNSLNKTIL